MEILQIERDTYGMLQCHPYPNEYVDASKQCIHCAFFMGLQRKQGARVQEGQQFDIRGTVDEFRHSVNMYMYWKPGMEIYVSHVRRRQIPSFVFPDGFKRPRPAKPTNQQKPERTGDEDGGHEYEGSPSEGRLKRKKNREGEVGEQRLEKRLSVSPDREKLSLPEPASGGSSTGSSGGSSGPSIKVDSSPECGLYHVAKIGASNDSCPSSAHICAKGHEDDSSQESVQCGDRETVTEAALLVSDRVLGSGSSLQELEVLHLFLFSYCFLLSWRFLLPAFIVGHFHSDLLLFLIHFYCVLIFVL